MLSSSTNLSPDVIYRPPKCHMAEGEETENARGRPSFMKKKRKTMWTFHKSLKSKRISFGAKKCNERYSLPDGWRDGGKKNFVFFVLSSTSSVIIRSADEWNMNCDWHVSTQTLDGGIQHHSQVGRDKKKSIGRGASPCHQEVAELKLTVTTRSSTRVTSSPARFKNKKRTGFSTPRWNEIGKQNMTWDKIHPKTINSSLYF
jgi:hypothetical protein